MKVWTIGFTKTSAERFFGRIRAAGVQRVVDVRLNNISQLAGFAKKDDLRYFLKVICSADYVHLTELAPTQPILDKYKKGSRKWSEYEREFLSLMSTRRIETTVPKETIDGACLLCSEDKPHYCHRRLVAEYLRREWKDLEVEHL